MNINQWLQKEAVVEEVKEILNRVVRDTVNYAPETPLCARSSYREGFEEGRELTLRALRSAVSRLTGSKAA
jgi:hypothetical protein